MTPLRGFLLGNLIAGVLIFAMGAATGSLFLLAFGPFIALLSGCAVWLDLLPEERRR